MTDRTDKRIHAQLHENPATCDQCGIRIDALDVDDCMVTRTNGWLCCIPCAREIDRDLNRREALEAKYDLERKE